MGRILLFTFSYSKSNSGSVINADLKLQFAHRICIQTRIRKCIPVQQNSYLLITIITKPRSCAVSPVILQLLTTLYRKSKLGYNFNG